MDDHLYGKVKGLVDWSSQIRSYRAQYEAQKRELHQDLRSKKNPSFDELAASLLLLRDLVVRKELPLYKYRLSNFQYLVRLLDDVEHTYIQSSAHPMLLWLRARAHEVLRAKVALRDKVFKQEAILTNMRADNYQDLLSVQNHLHLLEQEDHKELTNHTQHFIGHAQDFLGFVDQHYFKTLNKIVNTHQFVHDNKEYFISAALVGYAAQYLGQLHNQDTSALAEVTNRFVAQTNADKIEFLADHVSS